MQQDWGGSADLMWQVAVVLVALVAASLFRFRWSGFVAAHTSGGQLCTSGRDIALAGSTRIAFALALVLVLLLGKAVFEAYELPTGLLDLAVPLALAFAAIRSLVYLLRVAARPGGGSVGSELFVSITLWIGCAVYLLGWTPAVSEVLDAVALTLGEVRISLLILIKFSALSAVLILAALAFARVAEGRLSTEQTIDADNPELAMELLLEASGASDRVIHDPAPAARLLAFGDHGIDLELRVWIDDPKQGTSSVRSDINLAIWRAFKLRGITIPLPQRDVHLKQPATGFTDADNRTRNEHAGNNDNG